MLTAPGGTWDVVTSSFSFERTMDAVGQTSSAIQRCQIKLTVVASKTQPLIEWLLDEEHLKDGDITYFEAGDKKSKTVSFVDGYIQAYNEHFMAQGTDGTSASVADMVIMCRLVDTGGAKKEFQWSSNKVSF